jgi:hypothetical protein
VTFKVADYQDVRGPRNLADLGYAVKNQLHRAVPEFNQGTNPEGFTIDGLDVWKTDGTMNFYPAGIPKAAIPKVLAAIKYYLGESGAKFGEFTEDRSGLFTGETVYRIPVKLRKATGGGPEEVNVTNVSAATMLGLLNVPEHLQGSASARDLLIRIDNLTEPDIRRVVSPPSVSQRPGAATVISGGMDEARVRRTLDALRTLAKWAIDNDYDTIQWG